MWWAKDATECGGNGQVEHMTSSFCRTAMLGAVEDGWLNGECCLLRWSIFAIVKVTSLSSWSSLCGYNWAIQIKPFGCTQSLTLAPLFQSEFLVALFCCAVYAILMWVQAPQKVRNIAEELLLTDTVLKPSNALLYFTNRWQYIHGNVNEDFSAMGRFSFGKPSSLRLLHTLLRDLEADKWSSGQGEYQLVSRRTQVCPYLLPLGKQMPRVHCRTVLTYASSSLNRLLFTWGRKVCTYIKGICYLSLYL